MRRPLWLLALVLGLVLEASTVSAQTRKATESPKGKAILPGYKKVKCQGFTLVINNEVFDHNDDEEWQRKPLDVLDLELGTIADKLPDDYVKMLQRIIIWVEWQDRSDPDLKRKVVAKYYGMPGNTRLLLPAKGKHPEKANNVEIINMKSMTREHQPGVKLERCVLLHELAHAVHHQAVGVNNPLVKNAYRQAMARGLYNQAKDVLGRIRKPTYASTNEREYFAELTCAYLDKLHYYPFNAEDLKKHDPQGYKVMELIWRPRQRIELALKRKEEKRAAGLLAEAQKLYTGGKTKPGIEALETLLERYPQTKASGAAKKLLDTWKEADAEQAQQQKE
jgi:hypothetical protein